MQFLVHVLTTLMAHNQIKKIFSPSAQGHQCNIKEKGGKISRQGGNMLSRQPIAKDNLVEAIVFEGKVSYPKDISL